MEISRRLFVGALFNSQQTHGAQTQFYLRHTSPTVILAQNYHSLFSLVCFSLITDLSVECCQS